MPIRFTNPWFLLLILMIPYFIWVSRNTLADLSRFRRLSALGIRVAIVLILILALSGLQWVKFSDALTVIFVLDRSASISASQKDAEIEYVNAAAQRMGPKDRAGVIVFGTDASVELAPATKMRIFCIQSVVSGDCTDLAQGIRLALAAFPQDTAKRIVLLSDGNENLGNSLNEAISAGAGNVPIEVIPISSTYKQEALLDRLTLPSEVKIGEPFEMRIVAASMTPQKASLTLICDGQLVGRQSVSLQAGKTVIRLTQSLPKAGVHRYECRLDPELDTRPENNIALGIIQACGKPRVLLVEGDQETGNQGKYLQKALSPQSIDLTVKGPGGVPSSMADLWGYDSIILSDIPAWNLSVSQMQMLKTAVRDSGMGFGMIGGQDSFGAGGYYRTPIEEILPVDMDLQKMRYFPSVSLCLVIDKSGSMSERKGQYTKVDLAKEAAIEAEDLLSDQDQVGVICFDEAAKWVVPMQPLKNREAIDRRVATIEAGGGTSMYPALKAAYEGLQSSNTRIKHVILLTDGCSLPGDFDSMIKKLASIKATVTTVAIGTDSDIPLLKHLAKLGGGRFYYTSDPSALPQIFTRDTLIMSKSVILEEPFQPRYLGGDSILDGIDWSNTPPLLGYVATTPKSLSTVSLLTHKGDPLFTHWQYGLGHSFAFTSDAKARWAKYWLNWPGYSRFWAQTVRWSLRHSSQSNYQLGMEIDRGKGQILLEALDSSGNFVNYLTPQASVILPDLRTQHLSLQQVAPGRYEAEFDSREVGDYLASVSYKAPDGSSCTQNVSDVISYPPEFKDLKTNEGLLTQIAETSDGHFLDANNPSECYSGKRISAQIPRDIWPVLLILAMILFPLDVGIRRLMISPKELFAISKWFEKICEKRRLQKQKRPKRQETFEKLLEVKTSPRIDANNEAAETARHLREAMQESRKIETTAEYVKHNELAESKPEEVSASIDRLLSAKRRGKNNSDSNK